MNDTEVQGDPPGKHLNADDILYIDESKDHDPIQFIRKAQEQGCNCLDLSKRQLTEFPSPLLDFSVLQYLYLEGNQLSRLPSTLFVRLLNLKWLDLRHNQLTAIPSDGLAKHPSLQYLLLSGNRLRTLPFELGKVKTLSALNLDGNPLDYPPFEIIKQGIKAIQQYLRDKLHSDDESSSPSDDRRQQTPRYIHRQPSTRPRKSKSETGFYEKTPANPLPPHLRSCIQYKRMSCSPTRPSSSIRSRPQSEMRLPQVKTLTLTKKSNDLARDVYINEERALMHMEHRETKTDENIQHLYQKSFVINKMYEKPLIHTPFHIDPHYIHRMNREPRPSFSSENPFKEEEERRTRDRQVQERIRQITDQMLRRRLEARGNALEEKRQVKLELYELRQLESDGEYRPPIPTNRRSRAYSAHPRSRKKV